MEDAPKTEEVSGASEAGLVASSGALGGSELFAPEFGFGIDNSASFGVLKENVCTVGSVVLGDAPNKDGEALVPPSERANGIVESLKSNAEVLAALVAGAPKSDVATTGISDLPNNEEFCSE